MNNHNSVEVIHTVCTICEANCGMIVHIQDGQLLKTEGNPNHPISKGYLCPKGKALPDMLKADDRLRHPLKKLRDDSWQEISWDEALESIAANLIALKKKNCPHHLAIHVGQAGERKQFTDYIMRFCSVYGTPNLSTADSYCHTSRSLANTLTFGYRPTPDYENSNCIILWGYNPTQSSPPISNAINRARQRGARLIVVDPYSSSLASNADLHLQVRPGTDLVLALGLLNYIILHGLYDQEFVKDWTIGFEDLSKAISLYTPEEVAKITWVPADKIKAAARLYAGSSPACLEHGMALELQSNGFQTIRAIAILQAITGNLDIKGGALQAADFKLASLSLPAQEESVEAIGQIEFPLFHSFTGHSQANIYSNAILEAKPYPIESMIVVGSNPLLAWPNPNKVRMALERLGFLVVVDNFMTASARLADIVLPAATFLSQNELWVAANESGASVGLAPKVFEEEGCLSDWLVWNRLAQKMGYDDFFPWQDDEAALNDRLQPLGLSIESLRQSPNGYIFASRTEKTYLQEGFSTDSGKVEIYSSRLEQWGYDPLPGCQESLAGKPSPSDMTDSFPLTLSFGTRSIGYRQSKSPHTKARKKRALEPCLEMHPDKAREMGLIEGEKVIVASSRASIEINIAFNNDIEPRVVFIPHGWDQVNANTLTGKGNLDPITAFPLDRCINVRVSKKPN